MEGTRFVGLPEIPQQLQDCFKKITELPPGDWDLVKVTEVVARLKQSEIEKVECGNQLIAFYKSLQSL